MIGVKEERERQGCAEWCGCCGKKTLWWEKKNVEEEVVEVFG